MNEKQKSRRPPIGGLSSMAYVQKQPQPLPQLGKDVRTNGTIITMAVLWE